MVVLHMDGPLFQRWPSFPKTALFYTEDPPLYRWPSFTWMALFSNDGPLFQRWPFLPTLTHFANDGPPLQDVDGSKYHTALHHSFSSLFQRAALFMRLNTKVTLYRSGPLLLT